MLHKCKEYRLHQAERVISKRRKIANLFGLNYEDGTLRKHNMSCACGMCSAKHPGAVKKAVPSMKVVYKMKIMKQDIINEL